MSIFVRCSRFSKSDPAAWENFLVAYSNYVTAEMERSLSTPLGDAVMALGMARQLVALRNDFRDVQALMEKIKR